MMNVIGMHRGNKLSYGDDAGSRVTVNGWSDLKNLRTVSG